MSELVKAYESYYTKRNQESVENLFEELLVYNFSNYYEDIEEISNMHKKFARFEEEDLSILRTNGSTTGNRNEYEFGPMFDLWASKLEPYLRNRQEGKTILLYSRIGNGPSPKKMLFLDSIKSNKKDYDANADFSQNKQVKELFEKIKQIYSEFGKVNLSSTPDIWNMLFSNPYFNQLCLMNKEKINCAVNSDFEMFFKNEKMYIRDQMINWSSGLNFFTCRFGTKHFLPIFYAKKNECINLINLASKKDSSDSIKLHDNIKKCECGRACIPIDIFFHKGNNVLDKDAKPINFSLLAKSMIGQYKTFQVHQDEDNKISVLFNSIDEKFMDERTIKSFFSDLETNIISNKYFEIGSKRYCFWRSKKLNVNKFKS